VGKNTEKELWELAENDYMLGMKYKDIAAKHGVSINTVKSWKVRYKWNRKGVHTKNEKVCTQKESKLDKHTSKILDEIERVELTEKQQLFCLYYIKNFNATQAYLKAYNCSYDVANAEGYKLLVNPCVKAEIDRLKEIKRQSIMLSPDDIVERYMRIAFADMTDFVEFGRATIPVMTMFGPLEVENPVTGKKEAVTKEINEVRFKDHSMVDGGLICQIKQGKDGASLKLEDRQKALEWLANFFDMNPMDKHKQEYDKRKLEVELLKAEAQLNKSEGAGDTNTPTDDGFLDALNACAGEVWDDVGED
jgi:phage terminase small subunit